MPTFHYRTTTPLASSLKLAYQTQPVKLYNFELCARLDIPLLAGDLVIANAAGEASTPTVTAFDKSLVHAMHARYLKVATDSDNAGSYISRPMGHNVTASEHHSTVTCGGSYIAPADDTYHFLFVMYAASLNSHTDTRVLPVNYVELDVAVIRD